MLVGCPLLAVCGRRPPFEIPVAAAPVGWLGQHQNRWSDLAGAKVNGEQRLQFAADLRLAALAIVHL